MKVSGEGTCGVLEHCPPPEVCGRQLCGGEYAPGRKGVMYLVIHLYLN